MEKKLLKYVHYVITHKLTSENKIPVISKFKRKFKLPIFFYFFYINFLTY
jgi:hypothetical protein